MRVLDVGCGTGIATRLVARIADQVIGVEPNADMLRSARGNPGSVSFIAGRAEQLPIQSDRYELVVCAQSFHWFEPKATFAEFHRVLSHGGRLALLWNVRIVEDPLAIAIEEVVRRASEDASRRGRRVAPGRSTDLSQTALFGNSRSEAFTNPQRLDREGLMQRMQSASYFPGSGAIKAELEVEINAAFDRHQENGYVRLAQETRVTLVDRT